MKSLLLIITLLMMSTVHAAPSIMKLATHGTGSVAYTQHVVIKDINGGYVTRIYHTDIYGKVKLVNTSYMFNRDELSPSAYRLALIAADDAMKKRIKQMNRLGRMN